MFSNLYPETDKNPAEIHVDTSPLQLFPWLLLYYLKQANHKL